MINEIDKLSPKIIISVLEEVALKLSRWVSYIAEHGAIDRNLVRSIQGEIGSSRLIEAI